MPPYSITVIVACGILPLIASWIIWHRGKNDDQINSSDKSIHNIKNQLSEVTAKSDAIISAIGDGVIVIDSSRRIQLMNPAAQDILGWKINEAIQLNYTSVFQIISQNENATDNPNNPIEQVLNLNQQIRTDGLGLTTKGGKKILISLVVSPVGEAGSGVIAVFHDITKEKTEEREQAEFISTASHEMRTPVASIEGYLGLAMNPQTAQIDSRARDYIDKAHQAAQHLGHLFQDLLDVSKADDGRMSNNPKLINIVELTHDITKQFQPRAKEKKLNLTFIPVPDNDNIKHIAPSYILYLDYDHVQEIIDNLIENAIKYTPAGEIYVDISATSDHVVISVKDSGIGISPEDMPHLFQKFYRIDNKDTQQIGGTGLGLYLCRKIAESMGGKIWAESTAGIGSTFFVELPRISAEQAKIIAEQQTLLKQQALTAQKPIPPEPTKTPAQRPLPTAQAIDIVRPVNSVPRGQALTPEQIASYVAKQQALAKEMQQQTMAPPTAISNAATRPGRPLIIPKRS